LAFPLGSASPILEYGLRMSLFDSTASPLVAAGGTRTQRRAGPALGADLLTTPAWTLRMTLSAMGCVLAFAATSFLCWQWNGMVVPWDAKNHFYPMFRFLAEALHRGEIPLWNPYHFGGHPTIADPQSLVFTPSMVLLALIAPQASMQLFDGAVFAHLVMGGLGVVGIVRARHWHPAGAVLAAIIFMLGGSAASRLQHTGMIISYSFFPLALLSLEVALARRQMRYAVLFGILAALMALGRDQVAFLLCGALVGRAFFMAFESGAARAYLRARLGILALGGGLAIALLIVPSLLTLQFLHASNRPGIPFGVAVAGSLAPVNFMTLFVPDIFGSLNRPYDYWGPGYEALAQADWTDRTINYLFIGTVPILLIVWHGLAAGRLFCRGTAYFGVLLAGASLYAVGRYTPIFGLAFDWIPGVSLYRRPADATFLINIALALSAGYLLHRYIEDGLPRPFRYLPRMAASAMLPAATLTGCVLALLGALAFSRHENHLTDSLVQLALALGLFAAAGLALFVLRSRPRRALAAAILVAATGGELIWRNAASPLNAEPASHYAVFGTMGQARATGLEILRQEIATKTRDGNRPRVEILGLDGPWQNASMVFKLENTLGYNPLRIADYERAVGPGENAADLNLRHFPDTFRGYRCKLAALLGLEYLVLGRPLVKLPRRFPRPAATLLYASDDMYIYKLGRVAPRAYFATQVTPIDSDNVLDSHAIPDFDQNNEVLIDQASMATLSPDALHAEDDTPAHAHVAITKYTYSEVDIDLETDKAGVVVLHDLFYPGWEVRIDGEEAPVLRANILFRGVEVPAGHHVVQFSFHPLSPANLMAAAGGLLHRTDD